MSNLKIVEKIVIPSIIAHFSFDKTVRYRVKIDKIYT
jgi:hypothetical protein